MKDEFLYELRTEPPARFVTELKQHLDRRTQRRTRVLRIGLGVLLFGTAFAMVSPGMRLSVAEVIDWIRGTPASMPQAPQDAANANRGLARPLSNREVEPPDPVQTDDPARKAAIDEQVRQGVLVLLESEHAVRRRLSEGQSPPPEGSADAGPADSENAAASGSADASPDGETTPQSSFIVTGPLLAEVGTPAYMFQTRRAYFTVLDWTMQPLEDFRLRRVPLAPKTLRTQVARLASLTLMMGELFARDERGSGVPTRAKDAIWERPAEFAAQRSQLESAVLGLAKATTANDPDEARRQIGAVERACASCHDKFRKGGNTDVGAVTP